MPTTRGAGAAEEEDRINTLAAAVDTLQINLAAQAKAAEDAARDAQQREDRLRQADTRAKTMEDQMTRMMAQLTALTGQGVPATAAAAPPPPPAQPVQARGLLGGRKPPNASDVQTLDSDVTRQSLTRWR